MKREVTTFNLECSLLEVYPFFLRRQDTLGIANVFKGDNFCDILFGYSAHPALSEIMSIRKGKNLLPSFDIRSMIDSYYFGCAQRHILDSCDYRKYPKSENVKEGVFDNSSWIILSISA